MAYVRNKKKILKFWSKKKAALYVRVSTRYQVDKDSLPFQRKKLKEYCKFLGIERCPICGEQLIACEHGPNGKD